MSYFTFPWRYLSGGGPAVTAEPFFFLPSLVPLLSFYNLQVFLPPSFYFDIFPSLISIISTIRRIFDYLLNIFCSFMIPIKSGFQPCVWRSPSITPLFGGFNFPFLWNSITLSYYMGYPGIYVAHLLSRGVLCCSSGGFGGILQVSFKFYYF